MLKDRDCGVSRKEEGRNRFRQREDRQKGETGEVVIIDRGNLALVKLVDADGCRLKTRIMDYYVCPVIFKGMWVLTTGSWQESTQMTVSLFQVPDESQCD